ncbi:MAG: NAD(P)/FAD-dependent oxidoreductase [Gammaproteobacteria bacterium]
MSTVVKQDSIQPEASRAQTFDVVIVGAGFAGLYMLHRVRQQGLRVRLFEAGSGVGGTWYWNRYPGARVDVESMEYSYSFDEDLQQEWSWSERYAAQPELLEYMNHCADRFGLRPDMQFDTRVTAAVYDEATRRWRVSTDRGDDIDTKYCVLATGFLSAGEIPDFPGRDDFRGDTYLTSRWPHEDVDFSGKRVAVIGTGSSAIQAIPIIARQAGHLYVFQRTPSYSLPLRNGPLDRDFERRVKAMYPEWRRRQREESRAGFIAVNNQPMAPNDQSALAVSEAERLADYEMRWESGGLCYYSSFIDLLTNREANETLAEFVREKIRERVDDAETAELLAPKDYPIMAKRLCADTGYYETYNRDNVTLVSIKDSPIERLTANGVVVRGEEYAVDSIIFATGFDAVTGAISRIDVRGRDGERLNDHWEGAPRAYLGLMSTGFPNLFFLDGPCANGALVSPMLLSEYQVEWVDRCIAHLGTGDDACIEPTRAAEDAWMQHMHDVSEGSLLYLANSWYMGANIPGKPRALLSYLGGLVTYREQCEAGEAEGYRAKFTLTRAREAAQA